jgi:hypothetical protein
MYNRKKNYWNDAEYWIKRGVWVIPLTSYSTPPADWKGYNSPEVAIGSLEALHARTNPTTWLHGIGAILHLSGLVMLDIDRHKPTANGYISHDWLLGKYSNMDWETAPDEMTTWTMHTPGRGLHYLFKRPADFPKDFTKKELAPGVELIAHGQTPLPPTVKHDIDKQGKYVEKGPYQWRAANYSETPYSDIEAWNERFTMTYDQMRESPAEWEMSPEYVNLAPLPKWLTAFAKSKTPLMSYWDYMDALTPSMDEFWAHRMEGEKWRYEQELYDLYERYRRKQESIPAEEKDALIQRYRNRVSVAEMNRRRAMGLPIRDPRLKNPFEKVRECQHK